MASSGTWGLRRSQAFLTGASLWFPGRPAHRYLRHYTHLEGSFPRLMDRRKQSRHWITVPVHASVPREHDRIRALLCGMSWIPGSANTSNIEQTPSRPKRLYPDLHACRCWGLPEFSTRRLSEDYRDFFPHPGAPPPRKKEPSCQITQGLCNTSSPVCVASVTTCDWMESWAGRDTPIFIKQCNRMTI